MSKNILPPEIEEMVQNISDVPEPNAVFLNSLREQFISKGIEAAQKNKETPMIKISRRSFISPRLAWALGIALLIVILSLTATSPTVVNALKRMFGFVPGVGIVEETSSLRILASPFTVENGGTSVNIDQVAVDAEKTIVIYQYPTIDPSPSYQPPATFKEDRPALILPDGTRLDVRLRRRLPSDIPGVIRYLLEFPPLPKNVNDATLELTRLISMMPGQGPEDWSIQFHLIPAPAGMILPVENVQVTEPAPTGAPEAATSSSQTPPTIDSSYGIKSTLDSFVRMDDGILLIGSMQWDQQNYPAYAVDPSIDYATVTDATGKAVAFEPMYGVERPQNEEFRSYWAIKVTDKNFQSPLKIEITSMIVSLSPFSFQFDPGTNPKAGQSWPLNSDVTVLGKNVHFTSVQLNSQDDNNLMLVFNAQSELNFIGDLYLRTSVNQCKGGGGGLPTEPVTNLQVYESLCRSDFPPGSVDVQVNGADVFGSWVVIWQP
jgi:hypothetical protein